MMNFTLIRQHGPILFLSPIFIAEQKYKKFKGGGNAEKAMAFHSIFLLFCSFALLPDVISKAKAEDSYTVTYHANGGTFEDGSVTYGPPVEKKLPKLSRQTMSVMMAVLIPMDTVTTKRLQTK